METDTRGQLGTCVAGDRIERGDGRWLTAKPGRVGPLWPDEIKTDLPSSVVVQILVVGWVEQGFRDLNYQIGIAVGTADEVIIRTESLFQKGVSNVERV